MYTFYRKYEELYVSRVNYDVQFHKSLSRIFKQLVGTLCIFQLTNFDIILEFCIHPTIRDK